MKFTGKTKADLEAERQRLQEKAIEEARLQAYRDESDPLFFKWQRGEATKEKWLAKVAEIKERIK